MKKANLTLKFLAAALLTISQSAYSVWWNPLTWFEKDTKSVAETSDKSNDLYKTATICPRAAAAPPATQLKQAHTPEVKSDVVAQSAQTPKTSATSPFAAKTTAQEAAGGAANQDNCPAGQQLCVGNLGDDNNTTFCSAGDCPMGSAPVLNKPLLNN